MPRPLAQSPLMRPFVALAIPGMYLVYRYNQYKRAQQEANKRKAAEKELVHLHHKIDKLLSKLDEHEPELAMTQEEECVICVNAKATMQTFPCGHQVVCRKCFVKTIQVAVSQRLLPLRCVVCRAKILRLRQSRDGVGVSGGSFPSSVSQYSMASYGGGNQPPKTLPASHSLYSFTSGSSGLSGMSNVSSASSDSGDSFSANRIKGCPQRSTKPQINKRVKVNSKSGARSKEPSKGELPQITIENFEVVPLRICSTNRPPRTIIKENKVAPQDINGRLPTIKEYGEFIGDKDAEKEKSSSTRIRCAQKLLNQLEHNNNNKLVPNNNVNGGKPNLQIPAAKIMIGTPSPTRKNAPIIPTTSNSRSSTVNKTPNVKIPPGVKSPEGKPPGVKSPVGKIPPGTHFPNSKQGEKSKTKNASSSTKKSNANSNSNKSGGKASSGVKGGGGGPSTRMPSTASGGSKSSKSKRNSSIKSSASFTSNISLKSNYSSKSSNNSSMKSSKSNGSLKSSTKTSTSSFTNFKNFKNFSNCSNVNSHSNSKNISSGSISNFSNINNFKNLNNISNFSSNSSNLRKSSSMKSCRSLIPSSLKKDSMCQKNKEDKIKNQTKKFDGKQYQRL